MIVDEPEPGEEGVYIYWHKFGDLVSRLLTDLSLTVGIDNCLIEGENIEEVTTKLENILDKCHTYNTKLKQQRCEGKTTS